MKRSEMREHIAQMLFIVEFHDRDDIQEQASAYIENIEDCPKNAAKYMLDRFNTIVEKFSELDEIIESVSVGWKLDRMSKIDLTVLRLAVYEIKMDEEIPNKVAINEAVEIAKKYGGDNSPSFINGILAKVVNE
jgi:N utilization substance protein B